MSERDTRERPSEHGTSRVRTDGGESSKIRLGSTAEVISEPEKCFVSYKGEFYLLPENVLSWSAVEKCLEGRDAIDVSEMSPGVMGMIDTKLTSFDLDRRAEELQAVTDLSAEQARILLLYEGFEWDESEIAAHLDSTREAVENHLEDIYDHYDAFQLAEEVAANTELGEFEATVLVLTDGVGLSSDEIATELDSSVQEIEETLEHIRESYDVDIDL